MSNFKYSSVIMFLLNILLFANAYSSVIIVEDAKACYRRVLAGKRVHDRIVLRIVPCERLEDCQRECSEERRFDCETFNYRLDPSNRGKGICELTSTPLALLDVRKDFIEDRDYDFYELDRNSAPDCSLSWPHWLEDKRPGYQRPIRPQQPRPPQPRPPPRLPPRGQDHQGGRWDGHYWIEYETENRYGSNGGNRDYEDRFSWKGRPRPYLPEQERRWDRNFVPYEIAGGRKDHKSWGQYGGSYGHGHYDERRSEYWGLNDKHYLPNNSYYPNRGVTQHDHYGGGGHRPNFNYFDLGNRNHGYKCCGGSKDEYWGSYGNSYGSSHGGGSLGYGHHHHHHQQQHRDHSYDWIGAEGSQYRPYDCSSRSGSGFRMSRHVVRKGFSVPDIYTCEKLCFIEKHFACNTYSFRYSRNPSDNCFLSDRFYPSLDLYNDVQPDRDFDIYAMNEDKKYCQHVVDHHNDDQRYPADGRESECFWRVRSGRRLSTGAVKIALVANGIAECEAECLRATSFTCRAFSFRYGPPVIGDILENCQLTDWPQVGRTHEGLVESAPCELYERGSYGRGCEPNPFSPDSPNALGPSREPKKDELCFLQYDTSAKLMPEAVRVGTRLPTEHACKLHCSRLRDSSKSRSLTPNPPPFNCMSFSYTSDPHLPPHKDNCLLSDIQLRDLQPDLDYTHSKTHWLFAYNTFDPACNGGELPKPGIGDKYPPSRPPSHVPSFPPHGPAGYLPDRPTGPSGPSNHLGPYDKPPDHGWNRRQDKYPDLGADTWSVFTVSGWPCRRGTKCAPNVIAGYWSCELEGGEVGSWDYCCHPEHKCGHSAGFNYQWCYVGPSRQQWRPCSDRYYPYAQGPSHQSYQDRNHGSGYHAGSDWSRPPGYISDGDRNELPGPHGGRPYPPEGDRRYWDNLYKDGPQSYYDKYNNPRPGYVRVPTIEKNHIRYSHNYGPERPARPHWIPVRAPPGHDDDSGPGFLDPPKPGGFGVARYWPVAYLHKDAPPNSTFYKSDRERDNNIPRGEFDKRRLSDSYPNRRKDDLDKVGPSRKSDEKKNGGAQVLSIDTSAEVPKKDKDKENTTKKSNDEEKLVLVTTSKSDQDPKDKNGRIVNTSNKSADTNNNPNDKLDDKLEKFTDDNVEVFTVDEKIKNKTTEKELKANLERLLKEEKQIEEIGKAFQRRDERTRSEKRSQETTEKAFVDSFQPVFIPVDIETRSEKMVDYEDYRRGRAYPDATNKTSNNVKNEENHTKPIFDRSNLLFTNKNKNYFHDDNLSSSFTFVTSVDGTKRSLQRTSDDYKTITSLDRRRIAEETSPPPTSSSKKLTYDKENFGKSVMNNGQIFYEVLPDEANDKKPMGHIERVELKDYGVNVKVSNYSETTLALPKESREYLDSSFRTTVRSEIEGHSDSGETRLSDGQFGVRTGHVKKVEMPFTRNNSVGAKLIRRGRRNFRTSYDPSVVRRRLLEKQKLLKSNEA